MPDPLGPTPHEEHATELVRRAGLGEFGQWGRDFVALFGEAVRRGRAAEALTDDERAQREGVQREANALAATVGAIMDAMGHVSALPVATLDEIVDRLPHDARRRVIAYRHKTTPFAGAFGRDQFGPLPDVPPARSVLRQRERVVDVDPLDL